MKRSSSVCVALLSGVFFFMLSGPAAAQAPAPPLLDVTLGGRLLSRSLHYTDTMPERGVPNSEAPPDFSLPFGPAPFLEAGYYPLARSEGWLGHLGVVGSFETLVLTSATSSHPDLAGRELPTTYYRYAGGLRGRIPFESAEIGLTARYSGQDFAIPDAKDGNRRSLYPAASYGSVEGLLDGEYRLGSLSLGGYFGFLAPLSLGSLSNEDWFENARGYGLAGGAHLRYFFDANWGLTLNVDSRAYGFDFNPVPLRDPPVSERIAGGATDRYLSVGLGLTFRLPSVLPQVPAPAGQGASPSPQPPADSFDAFE
jgi:hypothetical protein